MLIFWGCTMLIVKNNDNEKGEMFSAPVKNNELLVCSEEGFNSIKVYRKVEDNDRIIAEIKITDNGELICDTKINFAKKAFEAVEDVLEQIAQ